MSTGMVEFPSLLWRFFFFLSVDRQLGYFHVLAITNDDEMNIGM